MRLLVAAVLLTCSSGAAVAQAIIQVPFDFATIQQAIDAAVDGDEIVVDPGVYFENIVFPAKNVHLRSSAGPLQTTIDGGGVGRCVRFLPGATNASIIEGFTLMNGVEFFGGGIACDLGAEPSIIGNRIVGNAATFDGGGIFPRPENDVVIEGNLIGWNSAVGQAGGLQAPSGASVVRNNVIVGNSATFGGGYFARVESSVELVNCTFSGNSSPNGSVAGGDGGLTLTNCVVWGNAGSPFSFFGGGNITATFCVLEGEAGQPWFGTGCIDADPLFRDAEADDFGLARFSPAIDAGMSAEAIGVVDVDGDERVLFAAVDIGADEFSGLLGTPDDYELHVGIDGSATATPFHDATAGSTLTIYLHSPGGAFVGDVPVLVLQVFGPPQLPAGVALYPGVHVDPPSVAVLVDGNTSSPLGPLGLGTSGVSLQAIVPAGLAGLEARLQGFTVSLSAANGILAATDAHDLRFN